MYKIIEFHITLITSLFIFHIAKSLLSYREGNLISEMRKLNENAYEENVQERNEERKVEEQSCLSFGLLAQTSLMLVKAWFGSYRADQSSVFTRPRRLLRAPPPSLLPLLLAGDWLPCT